MRNKLRKAVSLALAAAMTFSLAACGSGSSTGGSSGDGSDDGSAAVSTESANASAIAADIDSGDPVYGGTLVSYYTEFYNEYDPAVSAKRAFVSFYCDMLWNLDWESDHVYDSVYLDSSLLKGQVADTWEIADDYSSITVKLRDDVYFQDKSSVGMGDYDVYGGRQLTAEDVKWTYDRLTGIDGAEAVTYEETMWDQYMYMLDSVEVIDDLTVKFNLNTNTEIGVSDFMCARVLLGGPEWDDLTDDQKNDWHYASGTGPFIITDYVGDNTMTLTKNPDYWATDDSGNPLPYLDEVKLVYMTESTTILSSFISGELDTVPGTNTVFDTDEIAQLDTALGSDGYYKYTYYSAPMSIGLKQGNNPVEALTDVKVRTAMQYAMDLDAMSEFMGYTYDAGSAVTDKICGVFSQSTSWGAPDEWDTELLESYTTYDPDKAKELLAEAGYEDGFEFDVTIFSMLPSDLFQLASEYLSAVGITMNVNVANTPPEMTSVGQDADDPSSVFFNLALTGVTGLAARVYGEMDYVQFDNPEIEELTDAVQDAVTLDEQISAAKALDQAYMAQHYLLDISYAEKYDNFYHSNVHGAKGAQVYNNRSGGFIFSRMWKTEE